jgi:hypothetical protein
MSKKRDEELQKLELCSTEALLKLCRKNQDKCQECPLRFKCWTEELIEDAV